MSPIWNIFKYTLIESARNKIYFISLIFAVVTLLISRALAALSYNETKQMFFDFSLAGLNLVAVFLAIFLGVFLLQKESDPKSLILILSKPITRYQYLLGKYFGYFASILAVLFISAALLIPMFLYYKVPIGIHFVVSLFGISLDVLVCLSFVFLFSQISKLFMSLAFSFCFWLICHAHRGLDLLLENVKDFGVLNIVHFTINRISPDFSVWNWKDLFYLQSLNLGDFAYSAIYAICWASFYLFVASFIFGKKDCV